MSRVGLRLASIFAVILLSGCDTPDAVAIATDEMVIKAMPPTDIAGGADTAGIDAAAKFAWNQFFALNWPAVGQTGALGTRDTPDSGQNFLQNSTGTTLVWESFRSKTEVFPGVGDPHGATAGAELDYGYDELPAYVYDPKSIGEYPGLMKGQVPGCSIPSSLDGPIPRIELSEAHEVGPEQVFAGSAPDADSMDQRILYMVKVNRVGYQYVAENKWLDGGNQNSAIPYQSTQAFLNKFYSSPPAGSNSQVSFPVGDIAIKAAWRKLTDEESASGRFYSAPVRYYRWQDPDSNYAGLPGNSKHPCFVDAPTGWGLIGFHVKTKTPSAPYYIWTTFEQVDNILDEEGRPVENADGSVIRNQHMPATTPPIQSRNAVPADPPTPNTIQQYKPTTADNIPGKRLHYKNLSGTPTTQGTISINRRQHKIADPIISANRMAHQAILDYTADRAADSPWLHYKLVSVQWRPADKPKPGFDLTPDPDNLDPVLRYPSVYYQSNIVLESSHRLQFWSGISQSHLAEPYSKVAVQDLTTDFTTDGSPVKNVYHDGRRPDGLNPGYNMGGCMGCHGQMQKTGFDFSFIFRRGRVNAPEVDTSIRAPLQQLVHGREVTLRRD